MTRLALPAIFLLLLACVASESRADSRMALNLNVDARIPDSSTLKAPAPIEYTLDQLLRTRRFQFNDTTLRHPRFVAFCTKVYRWVEDNLNSYDPQYVENTGKSGKVRLVSDNWLDQNYFRIHEGLPLFIDSKPYASLGVAVNYSIISISHLWDLNTIVSGHKSRHRKSTFGLSMARLSIDAYYWHNDGPTTLRYFGDGKIGKLTNQNFDGLESENFGFNANYIFNWRRFCLSAPYGFSNYQRRSAGSWIVGTAFAVNNTSFDFSKLSPEINDQLNLPFKNYRLHYYTLTLTGGYSFNWVLGRHWLWNFTALPGVGMSLSRQNSSEGRKILPGFTINGKSGVSYCTRQFFAGLSFAYNGSFFLTEEVRSISGLGNLKMEIGVRF